MSVDLYEDIDNIIRSISPKRNVTQQRPTVLVNEVLVDVFMPLGRLSLDALQLTCRRFNDVVADHVKDYCLRAFDYKLPALGTKAIGTLGGVHLGCLTVSDTAIRTPLPHAYLEISAADLMPLLDSFAAVRELKLQGVTLTSARNDFLDFCRTRGILSVRTDYGATVDGDISVNAVIRFCFGPVSKELECEKRRLQGFSDFHGSVVNRVYKTARSKPKHVVKLSLRVGGHGNDDLRPLLDSKYQWDSEKKRYFRTLDNGVTLHWWFNEEKKRIDCKLIPYPREPMDEANKNKAAKE
ncbi:hypothetical protein AAVH_13052 [Aphelenchoides avenae]|nr:hypothetical protein AAVH_13052 [Aphelenchus avenae]